LEFRPGGSIQSDVAGEESMFHFILKRVLWMIPTFFGITVLSFIFINLAPGGPIEQKLNAIKLGTGGEGFGGGRGGTLINDEILQELKIQYGFDKPIHIRYLIWLNNIVKLDFGRSTTYEEPVLDVILRRFPVSMQFGVSAFFFSYILSIPVGILMAVKAKSKLDRIIQAFLFTFYAIPPLIFGMVLILVFASASYLDWFPTGGFVSDDYQELSFWQKLGDRIHHFLLPLIVYVIGGFASHVMLMRNSMLEVMKQDYVRTARAKGLSDRIVYFKHALRNAMIPMVNGMGSFISIFLSGSLIVESVFRLEGIGLLGYMSLMTRDYNLIMGLIFLSSILLMVSRLITDVLYTLVDPRIDFV
jgi:microcin C transport system permease protein